MSSTVEAARRRPRSLYYVGGMLVVAAAVIVLAGSRSAPVAKPDLESTYLVQRGDLTISVTESGSLRAMREENIKSEVEGTTRIISIVPEGIYITPEDVAVGKVLVELDSSNLRERLAQQEMNLAAATAAYAQAREAYDIQVNQNESNIQAAELKVRFARMDLERYLGERLTAQLGHGEVNCAALVASPDLAGAALQEKRKLESAIDLAREEVSRAEVKLAFTEKLHQSGYVSKEERDADALALTRRRVELEQAQTALDLFLRYEFPKQVLKLLSDLTEATRELERVKARARSELAKAEADRQSRQAHYMLQKDLTEKVRNQVEKCVIRATRPGLVVYANPRDWRGARTRIEEGAEVRERQAIINLPDLSDMVCEVKIHESAIERIRRGQRCYVTVDALPDQRLEGEVTKVSVLPDSTNWLNPNLKTYATEIALKQTNGNLKPGMSARAEIIVADLRGVIYVPVQAVFVRGGRHYCYVQGSGRLEVRPVKVGQSNDKFVVIETGLKEGERVLLYSPTPPPPLPPGEDEPARPAAMETAAPGPVPPEILRPARTETREGEAAPSSPAKEVRRGHRRNAQP